jgi:hypothetical protein
MPTKIAMVLVLLWLKLEALLLWAVVLREIEVFTLGHLAMLMGVILAVLRSRRGFETGSLGLDYHPSRAKVYIMPARRDRAA